MSHPVAPCVSLFTTFLTLDAMPNQNPEQLALDLIDAQLRAAGWSVQDKSAINFHAGEGQAIREYSTDTGPGDYMLFVD